MSQYQEMEQTVYNSLFTLIKDTSVLRDYAAAALLIVQVRALGPAVNCVQTRALTRNSLRPRTWWGTNQPQPHNHRNPTPCCAHPQESFQAAYAAFEPSMPQYSSSALPGGGYGLPQVGGPAMSEGNKYDPKPLDKFGDQAAGKVGRRPLHGGDGERRSSCGGTGSLVRA
jgi:hypothetical protein